MSLRSSGFTLIELMVVITILSALMVILLPTLGQGQTQAGILGDQFNMQFHYRHLLQYQSRNQHLPKGGGHELVLAPWVAGMVDRTATNRDRYFSPGTTYSPVAGDPRDLVMSQDVKRIWSNPDELSSQHSDYAALGERAKRGVRLGRGDAVLMAIDQEDGINFYANGEIPYLRTNGAPGVMTLGDDFAAHGVGYGEVVVVGAGSKVPRLNGLRY